MPKFDFELDQLVSVWQRSYYCIEADSYEEALSLMKEELDRKSTRLNSSH